MIKTANEDPQIIIDILNPNMTIAVGWDVKHQTKQTKISWLLMIKPAYEDPHIIIDTLKPQWK